MVCHLHQGTVEHETLVSDGQPLLMAKLLKVALEGSGHTRIDADINDKVSFFGIILKNWIR